MPCRKIYLASGSYTRQRLFRVLGLPVEIIVPKGIREKRTPYGSFAQLVKDNALKKAKGVIQQRQIKYGIVVGADTITVQGNRIFGKPKSIKQAIRVLRRLSGKIAWVYTGLAVVDLDNNKIQTSYSKTKVYMNKLSDYEIRWYFSYVSALDKSGSFDIQGRGSVFIPRIEGCFYNIIGLPLAELYRMFKKIGVRMLSIVALIFCITGLNGCVTEYNLATQQEEWILYSTDREIKIGRSISRAVEKKYELTDDALLQKRVEDIGRRIVAVCDRQEIEYHFRVIEDEEVNAFSLPGGFVYINKGLIEKVDNDDELACVLAHEVGHIVARHAVKRLQALMGYNFLRILVSQAPEGGKLVTGADIAFAQIIAGYSREDELLADQLGARYAKRAGFNPEGMISFLKKLQEIHRKKPISSKSYLRTHPYVPDRIRVVKQELGKPLTFDDYINIEQRPHGQ